MSTDNANPAGAGSDSVADDTPLSLSEAARLYSSEEADEANPDEQDEAAEEEGSDDAETSEEAATEGDEDEETGDEADPDEGEGQSQPLEASDDHLVTLQDGKKISVKELRAGYMMEADYRHKTHDLGVKRRDLEATAQRVNGTIEALTDYLSRFVPDMPDPSLAMTNPSDYVQRKAMHENALAQVQAVIAMGSKAKETAEAMTAEQRAELIDSENAKLVERLPFLAQPDKRNEFNTAIAKTAQAMGFTPEELGSNVDSRFYVLGYYAHLGMQAEEAKQKAAKKIANVPPVTPKAKPGARSDKSGFIAKKQAMARLEKTGSVRDGIAAYLALEKG